MAGPARTGDAVSCSTPTSKRTRPGTASSRRGCTAAIAEIRIQQEIILGIGGVRALQALGKSPAAWHLNEGHAAFVVLQRIHDLIDRGESFQSALEEVRRTTIFTTHTPVPAGHDAFPFNLVETHLAGAWGSLGASRDAFLALGHYDNGSGPLFNMTALALRASSYVNGVSQLHGQVTRDMWGPIWPGVADAARPVRAITNGVHLPTWLSSEMKSALRRPARAGLAGPPRRPRSVGGDPGYPG